MSLSQRVLITGGSGFIGSQLTLRLLKEGYQVVMLGRTPPAFSDPNLTFFKVDLLLDALAFLRAYSFEAVIHLAGQPIFGRWTTRFKQGIYDSRILSTRRLVEEMKRMLPPPDVFITASGFGYYGHCAEQRVDEASPPGNDFLARVCMDWEAEAKKIQTHGVRTVQIRTAHVLGAEGGLLAPLFGPFAWGLGAWFGQGEAWFPWIHQKDLIEIYLKALNDPRLQGPVNAVAPQTVRQKAFMQTLGKVMGKKVRFSLPLPFLRLFYGDLADTFDQSVQMTSLKLKEGHFKFSYPTLQAALKQIWQERKQKR